MNIKKLKDSLAVNLVKLTEEEKAVLDLMMEDATAGPEQAEGIAVVRGHVFACSISIDDVSSCLIVADPEMDTTQREASHEEYTDEGMEVVDWDKGIQLYHWASDTDDIPDDFEDDLPIVPSMEEIYFMVEEFISNPKEW